MTRFKPLMDSLLGELESQAAIEAGRLKKPFSRKTAVVAWAIGVAVVILALVWTELQR
jgi:hypothetical protein